MGRGPQLKDEEIGRIRGLAEGGFSRREISKRVGRSCDAVARVLQQQKKRSPKRPGRHATVKDITTRQIVRNAATGKYSARQLQEMYAPGVSVRTVCRLLARVDFLVYTKMDKTLNLTSEHKAARLARTKEHVVKGDAWGSNYWRDLHVPPHTFVKHQMGGGGGSAMVWGAFSKSGKSRLAVLGGRQTSREYIYTVSEFLLPFAHLHHGTEFVYQQDNAPIHVSGETREFFQDMELDVMKWPARSPDLNPIENLWAILSNRVYTNSRQYSTVQELTQATLREWEGISVDTLSSLVNTMPSRCIEVIERRGNKTHY